MNHLELGTDLPEILADACAATGTPGAALGVLMNGTKYFACHGVMSVDGDRLIDPGTRFSTGCIVKVWLAVVAMRLADAGVLSLDSTIGGVRGIRIDPCVSTSITIRQLLSYSSGLDCNIQFDQTHFKEDEYGSYAALLTADDILHAPGQAFSYGPGSYIILAHVLERVTGEPINRLLDRFVFEPAGIVHDIYDSSGEDEAFADGHFRSPLNNDVRPVPRGVNFARCYSVAHDLAGFSITEVLSLCHFALTLRSRDGECAPASIPMWRRMCVPQVPVFHSHLTDWGIGWSIWGTESAGHNGYFLGHSANVRFSLTSETAIVLLSNRHEALDLYERIFDKIAVPLLGARTSLSRPGNPIDGDLLCFTGQFHGADVCIDVELVAGTLRLEARLLRDRSGGLIATAALIDETYRLPKSLVLRRLNRDVFASDETSSVTFLDRDEEGTPRLLRFGNKVLKRVA